MRMGRVPEKASTGTARAEGPPAGGTRKNC
jgi:hypothetical protein